MADPKIVALRAQLREAKDDAKRHMEVKKVMDKLLIKTEKKVAREESAERKRSWRTERFAASTPSPRSLATRPAHTAFQFKQGKKYFVCVACKRTFGSNQALSRHRQQQHTALGKRRFKCPACTYTGIRRGEVVNRHIRNRHPKLVGKISPQDLEVYAPTSPIKAVGVATPRPGTSNQWQEEDPLKSPLSPQEELPSLSSPHPQEIKKSPEIMDIGPKTTISIATSPSVPDQSLCTVATSPLMKTKDLSDDKAVQTGSKGAGQISISTQTIRNRNSNQGVQTSSVGAARLEMVLVKHISRVEVRPDGTRTEVTEEEWKPLSLCHQLPAPYSPSKPSLFD